MTDEFFLYRNIGSSGESKTSKIRLAVAGGIIDLLWEVYHILIGHRLL
jgi:hypothetical protein